MRWALLWLGAFACGGARPVAVPAPAGSSRLAELAIPGDRVFADVARDVIDVVFAIDPSGAASAGLFDDALRVPSYRPDVVDRLVRRLDADLAILRSLRPQWRTWPVDQQIDFRWIYANAETARRQLVVERMFRRRPAAWLEPVANVLIAFASWAPDDRVRPSRIWKLVPGMVDEMRVVAVEVTRRDQDTALKLVAALVAMAERDGSPEATLAVDALRSYKADLAKLPVEREFAVIGSDNYAWRLRHTMLLDITGEQLLAEAGQELVRVDGELAMLAEQGPAHDPTDEQRQRAQALTRDELLALYDDIQVALRRATVGGGFVTVPAEVGPINARETPEAMVPLTGDGGSMNPPPPLASGRVGYWNVERFRTDWSIDRRVSAVATAERWKGNWMGPYAAHEGFPGHHLQLSIARLHVDPIRSILPDPVQNEGWALYAEEALLTHGGFGSSPQAKAAVLGSYRARVARVIFGVNVETGAWDLQRGADFKHGAKPGQGHVDEELLRTIQWPTQLVCYFAGKRQIQALKQALQRRLGAAYSDRAFHDALLAEGSIPIALIRAKLLGEPVPDL